MNAGYPPPTWVRTAPGEVLTMMVHDITFGVTHQTDDLSTLELAPRLGARLHILSNLREKLKPRMRPFGRLALANLSRIEYRNFWYSGGDVDSEHEWQFRNRIEFRLGSTTRISM